MRHLFREVSPVEPAFTACASNDRKGIVIRTAPVTLACVRRIPLLLTLALPLAASPEAWIPPNLPSLAAEGPTLCPGPYLTPEQGAATLEEGRHHFSDRRTWERYAAHARDQVQAGAGLKPFPRRTPLNPVRGSKRIHDGYTVENVAFESVPGYFVCGNLYRPSAPGGGGSPVVLSLHGHGKAIATEDDYARQGRFTPWMQARCATLARLGAVVLSIEMVGYGESIDQVTQEVHKRPFSLTLQTWNAMRALDFLLSLEGVDGSRVAVSGESGGGTQTILLTALDPRVTLSAPVVMVSSYFFGGCPCESGLPIHRNADHFASNVFIAGMAAPRPMLLVSDGDDWTKFTAVSEFPFLRHIYGLLGARDEVENVHLPTEKHDYGPSKRAAFYDFVSKHFGLNPAGKSGAALVGEEATIPIETHRQMRVFSAAQPRPTRALTSIIDVEKELRSLQQ
ncbi:MAG: acetylxylan esterase [Opitutaceae bacterium]|nr:acetylxylan esterase [Opitutaceae bacterium]